MYKKNIIPFPFSLNTVCIISVTSRGECDIPGQDPCDHICLPRLNDARLCACANGYRKVGETQCAAGEKCVTFFSRLFWNKIILFTEFFRKKKTINGTKKLQRSKKKKGKSMNCPILPGPCFWRFLCLVICITIGPCVVLFLDPLSDDVLLVVDDAQKKIFQLSLNGQSYQVLPIGRRGGGCDTAFYGRAANSIDFYSSSSSAYF